MSGGKHLLGRPKRHIFGTAKVGEKGQIVIPKDARTLFGIQPGDTLLILATSRPASSSPSRTSSRRRRPRSLNRWRDRNEGTI